jgi:hypothetical protein
LTAYSKYDKLSDIEAAPPESDAAPAAPGVISTERRLTPTPSKRCQG